MEIKTRAKKWGSSLGIILPKSVIKARKIRENDDIIIEIKNRPIAGKLFGKLKNWKKPTQEIKDEMRKGWD